jgi:hypothetical protein
MQDEDGPFDRGGAGRRLADFSGLKRRDGPFADRSGEDLATGWRPSAATEPSATPVACEWSLESS